MPSLFFARNFMKIKKASRIPACLFYMLKCSGLSASSASAAAF